MNWVQSVTYDVSNRMTSMQAISGASRYGDALFAQKTMTYNANGQTTSINWSGGSLYSSPLVFGPSQGITYSYAAQTNGQISQAVDTISGETITYQYDALKRLTSASSTPNAGVRFRHGRRRISTTGSGI